MRTLFLLAISLCLATSLAGQATPAKPPATPTPPAAPAPAAPGGALNPEEEMKQMFDDIQSSFSKGQYDVALQKTGAFHTKTNNKDFPQVIFIEAACHFNLKQFDKAAVLFEKFVQTYKDDPDQASAMNDAMMALGESYLSAGQAEKGIEALKKAAAVDELRDRAGLMIASHYKKAGQADEAIQILEVVLKDQEGTPTQEQQQAILMASDIYVGKGDTEKASALMERLRSGTSGAESIVELNILAQKVGDSMLEASRFGEALRAYQSMRRHSELVRLQKERLASIERWVATIAAGGRIQFMGKLLSKEEADALLAQNKKVLEDIEAVKDYDANIFYRLGQCFFEMKRFHEAILAFKEVYENYREFAGRDGALYGMIASNSMLERAGRAYKLCEVYMKDFPDGKFIGEVTQMFGSLAYESGNLDEAESSLQRVVSSTKDKDQKVALLFLLGVVQFESQKFDASRGTFQTLVSEHKDAVQRPAAQYYIALSYFFQNDSKNTRRSLRDYIAANPKGEYIVDARYRLAFIEVQAQTNMNEALQELEKLTQEHPNDQNIGQVWSLMGDIYGQRQPTEEEAKKGVDYVGKTMEAYRNAVAKAKSPDVINYAIENATNLMVEKGMWKELSDMWSAYYGPNQGKPEALKAIYWITRAKDREAKEFQSQGKVDEAKAAEQEARKLVAKEMGPHLGNPANEQVEVLIQQLTTMMVPKRRPRAVVAAPVTPAPAPAPAPTDGTAPPADAAAKPADGAAAPAAPTPAPAPVPASEITFEQVEEEFKQLVTPEGGNMNGTAA
ncbi:MAG TPA: tetratricopeptide repeat protein, partial [Candidatus Saccharimonadia bacterium]|nr:tetratricopeptide repeat protein [Candidatus Saccharimonadia bacterium]